ncbi:hypothetical protein LPJ69_002519 [Coemansia sp. RSA 1752]|nr:hypothetical protein LPJ69_002519 [Coemansia sp. RSA 1752]KAJ1789533.1 hypothetical protein LPJ67_002456 [Coemansia sp. RSA 1938]
MLSTNTLAKPHMGGLGGHYPGGHRRATIDASAAGQYAFDTQQRSSSLGIDGSVTDSNAAAASAFAMAAMSATSSAVTTAATLAAHMVLPQTGVRGSLPAQTMGQRNDNGSPVVAPRPVAAQLAPPWMLAALPWEMLLGLSTSSHKQKIINDVFFTPEQRHETPQLTPVSDMDDVRVRAPAMPSDGLEGLESESDLALFADLQGTEGRSVWGEIDAVCAASPRQPSPAATVTCDSDDVLRAKEALLLSAHVEQAKSQYECDSDTLSLSGESCVETVTAATRESLRPTVFEELSRNGVDWCRYCGTTEGINWRPGPWGKRTLCNKHGCDYKGYGFASKMPRLNLKSFADEALESRIRPVLQTFCQICQQDFSEGDNILAHCDGCHRAYHQSCHPHGVPHITAGSLWFCEPACRDNARRKRILVELPKCRLPYMCSPRHAQSAQSEVVRATGPIRTTRARKRKTVCASPEPMPILDTDSKVRKSSRVTRPSIKRLESTPTL